MNSMFFSLVVSFIALSSVLFSQSSQGLTPQTRRYFQNVQYCNITTDCDALNSICHAGRCMCSSGYIPYRETPKSRDICFKEATVIGDFCNKDVQCTAAFGTHAECKYDNPYNLVGRCQCKNYAHFLNGICYRSSYIGQQCEVNDNCLTKSKHIYAFCDHSVCICPPGHHPSEDGTDCVTSSGIPVQKPYYLHHKTSRDIGNFQRSRRAKFTAPPPPPSHHPSDAPAGVGGSCVSDVGCIVLNSECKNGYCSCQKGHILSGDKKYCLTIAEKLGESCVETLQCRVQLNRTICNMTRKVCACEPGTHSMNGACWKSVELLQPCSHDVECLSESMPTGAGVHCSSGICQCQKDYEMESRKYCMKAAIKVILSSSQGQGNSSIVTLGVCLLTIFFRVVLQES